MDNKLILIARRRLFFFVPLFNGIIFVQLCSMFSASFAMLRLHLLMRNMKNMFSPRSIAQLHVLRYELIKKEDNCFIVDDDSCDDEQMGIMK